MTTITSTKDIEGQHRLFDAATATVSSGPAAAPPGPNAEPISDVAAQLRLNEWALSGDWTVTKEATTLNKANGRIGYRFQARDLHLVMGPKASGTPVRFRVLINGQAPAQPMEAISTSKGTVRSRNNACTS